MLDPQTPEEWQLAVEGADDLLLLDAAIQYGLIVGTSGANVDRCVEILERGTELGIFPSAPDRRRVTIGRWLRRERHRVSVSQQTIARRAGLSQARISTIERERADVSAAELERLRSAIEHIKKEKQ